MVQPREGRAGDLSQWLLRCAGRQVIHPELNLAVGHGVADFTQQMGLFHQLGVQVQAGS
ncbi:hypothetical protein [Deinococcus radiophilus]|uniref:hypothetical protein n=1 Tax=Deinococcus radiophilus TaxID=32062 RepID=UPI0036D290F5